MELRQITEKVYFIPNPANIGVIRDGKMVILIDSGLDDDTGIKILKALENYGLYLKAIINTHSHADHCGGNAYLKEKTCAKIYAPEIEAGIIQYSYLEPFYFFSGASPIKDLKNKFLMARPSRVDYVIKNNESKLFFDKIELKIVRLPGHSPNQIGIGVENVLFCADSIISKDTLKKHKIPFCVDIDKQKKTLNFLKESKYKFYVPSHAKPLDNILDLAIANLKIIEDVEKYLIHNIRGSKTTEEILRELCNHYKIEIKSIQQYYLMNTVTMAYLSFLYKKGRFELMISGNTLYWKKI
ncbi:MBL fold metallo-hydrolase [Caloranaerobacter sp. DY30410]|uniref:MBL fold metallo-hydrolase n=1 Tax=Caloranaerobacter sp. DY30410 TaxID=3238305 RepID=UPI003D058358